MRRGDVVTMSMGIGFEKGVPTQWVVVQSPKIETATLYVVPLVDPHPDYDGDPVCVVTQEGVALTHLMRAAPRERLKPAGTKLRDREMGEISRMLKRLLVLA